MLGVILAAGKGTRMHSNIPKVIFEVGGKSMIRRVLDTLADSGVDRIAVICGYGAETVKKHLDEFVNIDYFEQKEQRGTGHAVMQVDLSAYDDEYAVIIPGDTPLFTSAGIKAFIDESIGKNYDASILSTMLEEPYGYGRVIRREDKIKGIVEHKDANPAQLAVKEVNTGVYVVKKILLEKYLMQLNNNNAQGEYYLTDIFKDMIEDGCEVGAYVYPDSIECMGVNSRTHLMIANAYYKKAWSLL